ncbi:hypothetical protein LUZ60_013451 [Juncus effusus]|nr:hypothetical protein LUZ60_013451 [Juncus effusus]
MAAKSYRFKPYVSKSASTMVTKTEIGYHQFKIEGYSFNKGIGIGKWLTSATFTIGGFDWAIRYYPDGDSEETKDYLAFYLELMSTEAMVKVIFDLVLLNHSKPCLLSPRRRCPPRTFHPMCRTWGYTKFIERKAFETSSCLKDNSFVIYCVVSVIKPSCFKSTELEPVIVPPSDLDLQLHSLLESGERADVTFEVGGEIFRAHKLVLGMRSRVFRAHFFGEMREKQAERIKLENIEAEVFRVFSISYIMILCRS